MAMTCGIRAIAPAAFSSIYAASVRGQILGGYFIWVIFFLMALVLTVMVNNLPEKAEGKINKRPEHEA